MIKEVIAVLKILGNRKFLTAITIIGLMVIPLISHADNININDVISLYDGPGNTGGGEFQVFKGGAYQFDSFCLERTEYFYFGQPLTVAGISDRAINGGVGPGGDSLDPMTAYLYTQFRSGTYSLYGYGSGRAASADALQYAIWYIEGEWSTSLTGLALDFYNDAFRAGWTDIGNVQVLNLVNLNGGRAQDQLVLAPVPEPSTILLIGSGLIGFGIFGRKRFRRKE
jgi:hypothetical protein